MPPWILVAPSSRGIGLALASRLLRTTKLPVVATTRGNTDETKELILENVKEHGKAKEADGKEAKQWEEKLHVLKLDFKDEDSIVAAASACSSLFTSKSSKSDNTSRSHLHLAFVIPGILYPEKSPSQLDVSHITETFQINTISHLLMLKHFSRFLPRKSTTFLLSSEESEGIPTAHATWAAMSARVGSISDNSLGGWYSYRSSKAAVNQITKTFDNYLKSTAADKAMAISMHPGTVKTGLSKEFWGGVKEGKLFSPEFAVERLCKVVEELGVEGRGRCWDWNGTEIPP